MWKSLITNLIVKVIPNNWYTTKKVCDVITKVCDTVNELKYFVFPTIIAVAICFTILGAYWFKYRIMKLKSRL
jgi:hypothetical protein